MDIPFFTTPRFDERRDNAVPQYIIVHGTETEDGEEAHYYYMGGAKQISPHYMVMVDGSIRQYVHEDKRAWHAGIGHWRGIDDMNSHSIGIEVVNGGEPADCPPYNDAQIETLIKLGNDICARWNIPPQNILGHKDIAPIRKRDPGRHFPWQRCAEGGFGFWPQEGAEVEDIKEALVKIGYNPNRPEDVLMRAFQDHYVPEIWLGTVTFRQGIELTRKRIGYFLDNLL
ncbi:MAG: N-acetylmuramoyl-L-alanine amidase [Alphaproteobacteria bacterium]|nr:N-acetylmuramoyl-L-alanine amidase [Alphaproteobacteria bacterium]